MTLDKEEVANLHLWMLFLAEAHHAGISMEGVTISETSEALWCGCCPFGTRVFLLSGRAWRVRIPELSPIHGANVVSNVLKFLGMMIAAWLVVVECKELGSKQDCVLTLGTTLAPSAGCTNPAS
jgi:hypothetical protein